MNTIQRLILPLIALALTQASYGQVSYRESSATGHGELSEYKTALDEIDEQTTHCDTLFFRRLSPTHSFKGIYFDRWSNLRKYVRERSIHDASHDYFSFTAYYDPQGELISVWVDSGGNCDQLTLQYFIRDGLLEHYTLWYDCDCCEEEDIIEDYINSIRPSVGDKIKLTDPDRSLEHFLKAENLLGLLSGEFNIYNDGPEFGEETQN